MRRVFIRADSGPQIGFGHITRCLSLAQMLRDEFSVVFVCQQIDKSLEQEVIHQGFSVSAIQSEEQIFLLLSENDIVVLDQYDLTLSYQKQIKEHGCKLVCIDDIHEKEFVADLIINHAPGISPANYKALPHTKFALGPDYALLKPGFLFQARAVREIRRSQTLFICFGGADPINLTKFVTGKVAGLNFFRRIIVVTGGAYQFQNLLKEDLKKWPLIEYYHDVRDTEMLELMITSDMAIVPSSGILFECLACGCKAISSFYVDNQRSIFEGFRRSGAIFPITSFRDITASTFSEAETFKPRRVIDGGSAERLLNMLKEV